MNLQPSKQGVKLLWLCKQKNTMKSYTGILILALSGVMLVQACGPSEEELRQREQARLDSLERVRVERIEQARLDSMAVIQRQQEEAARAAADIRNVSYAQNGPFSVQVGSWRSEAKAAELVALWKSRGFENAYMVKYGNESTGDVWFRVRMGNVSTLNDAEKLMLVLIQDHQTVSWIDNVR
jgi:cell division protein FtsN